MNGWDFTRSPKSLADQVTTACLMEATARKPGNVHPEASFADTTYADFVASAKAIGPILADASCRGVGQSIHDAVAKSRQEVGTNTHLGTILLLAPLAAVPVEAAISAGLDEVLRALDVEDTRLVYAAIRIARPGGLGRTDRGDVAAPPPRWRLVAAMQPAADHDLVARQYVNGFAQVQHAALRIQHWLAAATDDLETAILLTFLELLRDYPDSLIARKCGLQLAVEAAGRAGAILRIYDRLAAAGTRAVYCGTPFDRALEDFDRWLRDDGNQRNPGTTADLVAAALFVLLRESRVTA